MGIDMEHITLEIGLVLSESEWPIERLAILFNSTFSVIFKS